MIIGRVKILYLSFSIDIYKYVQLLCTSNIALYYFDKQKKLQRKIVRGGG